MTGITFLQLCPVIHSSLNKADDCGSPAMAGKKKIEEEAISEILVAGTDSESGAEISGGKDYFEEEEEEEEGGGRRREVEKEKNEEEKKKSSSSKPQQNSP